MRRRGLLWQLFPSYLLITVVAIAAVSLYSYVALRDFYIDETRNTLTARAKLLEERMRPLIADDDLAGLSALARELGANVSTRITVISSDGRVLADSDEDASAMDNHADRPEITAALSDGIGTSRRYSYTLEQDMMYVAVPAVIDGAPAGVLRVALPLTAVENQLQAVRGRILIAALLLLSLTSLLSLGVSERIARPLRWMERGALRFSRGDFEYSIPVSRAAELASLAESMNKMAADLDARMRTITQQRAEQEAVFASMVEGVIAVGSDERVIIMNRAAADMLGTDVGNVRGRSLGEFVRITRLHEVVESALKGDGPLEAEIDVSGDRQMTLEVSAAPMKDDSGTAVGAVVVLNDVTRLRRLERVRRDFVANVSHELRTPVTAIKGFVETLREEIGTDPGNADRFLGIIVKHVDRLNAVIEDLLCLSSLEEDSASTQLAADRTALSTVLSRAAHECESGARERGVDVRVSVEDGLEASLNQQLFEHAIINLLDNAIKYSPEGASVELVAEREGGSIAVAVRDQGIGIAEEQQSRIFERFYCVDKGRSRELGGTGLGLSIAKHIVQAHGGTISVESKPNKGSTFTIRLPDGR